MVTLGGHYQKILAVGGFNFYNLEFIEEWNDGNETWIENPTTLQVPRNRFAALAIPKSRIC